MQKGTSEAGKSSSPKKTKSKTKTAGATSTTATATAGGQTSSKAASKALNSKKSSSKAATKKVTATRSTDGKGGGAKPSRPTSPPTARQTATKPSDTITENTTVASRKGMDVSGVRIEEGQILTVAKESKDRLLVLHDSLKERLDGCFSKMQDPGDENQRGKYREIVMQLKMLVGRLQLGIYDSHLIIELCHYLQAYDQTLSRCKEEARRLLVDNGRIRERIENMSEESYGKEAQLAVAHEQLSYWESMSFMALMEINADGMDLSPHELWKDMLDYGDFNLRNELYHLPDPERSLFNDIRKEMCTNNLSGAVKKLEAYADKHGSKAHNMHYTMILMITANYCVDGEKYGAALRFLECSYPITQKLWGSSSGMACTIGCRIASIYWMDNRRYAEAMSSLQRGLLGYLEDSSHENSTLTYRLFFNIGYFHVKKDERKKGVQIMEVAYIGLEDLVGKHPHEYLEMCYKLCKVLNLCKYYSDALYIAIEGYQFFLSNFRKSKVEVYDLALKQDRDDIACEEQHLPSGDPHPSHAMNILGEMYVAFCGCMHIAAGDFIRCYMEACRAVEGEVMLSEKEMQVEIQRIMDRNEKKPRRKGANAMTEMTTAEQFCKKRPIRLTNDMSHFIVDADTKKGLVYKTIHGKDFKYSALKALQSLIV